MIHSLPQKQLEASDAPVIPTHHCFSSIMTEYYNIQPGLGRIAERAIAPSIDLHYHTQTTPTTLSASNETTPPNQPTHSIRSTQVHTQADQRRSPSKMQE